MRLKSLSVGLAALAMLGCSSGDTMTAPPSYADVSGSFAGPISGTSQGIAMSATFSVTIAQSGSSISGTDAIAGTLNVTTPFTGSGTFTGTIASGNNPSVSISGGPACGLPQNYSGTYDSANHRLTITGPFYVFNQSCAVVFSATLTLVLSK
jgi:hypothetical protein